MTFKISKYFILNTIRLIKLVYVQYIHIKAQNALYLQVFRLVKMPLSMYIKHKKVTLILIISV